jgi:hypothetical protein
MIMLIAISWRNQGGGIAAFEYRDGATTSQPMSQTGARVAADQAFGHDQALVELDGGYRWTKLPMARRSRLVAAFAFSRGHRLRP